MISEETVSGLRIRPGTAENMLAGAKIRAEVFRSEAFIDAVLDDLRWEGMDGRIDLLSLDVFDTVLVRDDVSEIRRFWEIAQRVADRLDGRDATEVLISRLTATRASYRCSTAVGGYREGELQEIHALSLSLLGADAGLAADLVAIELEYEAERLSLNPAVGDLWKAMEEPTCVAVSNMYMSVDQISHLLQSKGADYISRVYSSTEAKMSKNDTRLLRHARNDASGEAAERCVHIGDSLNSDFVPARRLGWLAQWWPIGEADKARRRADAVNCLDELETIGLPLGSLGKHFVENP